MCTKYFLSVFALGVLFSSNLFAWERMEQLVIPENRELLASEEANFSSAVNALVSGKTKLAVEALTPLATNGVVDAQVALGTLLGQSDIALEKKESMKWLYYAAHGGNWHAQVNVAKAFRDGRYTDVDYEKSRHWLKRASKNGDANAISEESIALNDTMMKSASSAIDKADYKTAEKYLTSLAEAGVIDAQEQLAQLYDNGFLGEDAIGKANKWFQKAANGGSKNAQFDLAMAYLNDKNASNELKQEGIKLLSRAAAPGPAEAQYQLGMHYLTGNIVEKDQKQGIFFYRMAAEQGHVEAQYSLGVRYVLGEGVTKDEYEAHRWFKNAANHGLAKAMHNLALTYLYGMGTEKQPKKADQWFRSAASNGISKSETYLKPAVLVKTSFSQEDLPEDVADNTASKTTDHSNNKLPLVRKKIKSPVKFQTVKGGDWFLNLPNKGYTLQMLSAVKKQSVDKFFVEHNIKKKDYLHYIDRASKRSFHVIQYGYYDSHAEAKKAAKTLSRNNQKFKPLIRSVRTIKSKIANL